jgi:hypothetical protein
MHKLNAKLSMATLFIVGIACMNGFAASPLTLDDFKSGDYVISLNNVNAVDLHYAQLAPGSLLGAARYTAFTAAPNPWAQKSTLDIGKGICVVDSGFGVVGAVQIIYGATVSGKQAPLGLNLGGYSAFRLNFAGIATSQSLLVVITVWPHSGGYFDLVVVLPPSGNPFPLDFPFASFKKGGVGGGLTQSDVGNIDYIDVQAQGGGFASFGITSFEAVN